MAQEVKMSIENLYEFIKDQTQGKKCNNLDKDCTFCRGTGNKVISAEEMINNLDINEQSIYNRLNTLSKFKGIKRVKYLVRRTTKSKTYLFNITYWWYEE